jgi:hypothetical protein
MTTQAGNQSLSSIGVAGLRLVDRVSEDGTSSSSMRRKASSSISAVVVALSESEMRSVLFPTIMRLYSSMSSSVPSGAQA